VSVVLIKRIIKSSGPGYRI